MFKYIIDQKITFFIIALDCHMPVVRHILLRYFVLQLKGDGPPYMEVTEKLRKEIEDEKKTKKYLEKNMQDLKAKICRLRTEASEQVINKQVKDSQTSF